LAGVRLGRPGFGWAGRGSAGLAGVRLGWPGCVGLAGVCLGWPGCVGLAGVRLGWPGCGWVGRGSAGLAGGRLGWPGFGWVGRRCVGLAVVRLVTPSGCFLEASSVPGTGRVDSRLCGGWRSGARHLSLAARGSWLAGEVRGYLYV
jgi:hypothetical protein